MAYNSQGIKKASLWRKIRALLWVAARTGIRTYAIPYLEKITLSAARIPVRPICELYQNRKPILQASVQ
jgi:enoyl-[acyl-carrier-protein] reductase (NADH)